MKEPKFKKREIVYCSGYGKRMFSIDSVYINTFTSSNFWKYDIIDLKTGDKRSGVGENQLFDTLLPIHRAKVDKAIEAIEEEKEETIEDLWQQYEEKMDAYYCFNDKYFKKEADKVHKKLIAKIEVMKLESKKYKVGDKVKCISYESDTFIIEEITNTSSYRDGEYSFSNTYVLRNTKTREIVQAEFDDLFSAEEEDQGRDCRKFHTPEDERDDIDVLLDKYNNMLQLYEIFGDEEYKTKANKCLEKLNKLK